jgi:hypothetical protein
MSKDDFDLSNLVLPPDVVVKAALSTPRRIAKRATEWVKLDRIWVDRLKGHRGHPTMAVAFHLIHETWKCNGGSIKVPNGMLEIDGVTRKVKWRVLNEFEEVGLISIERRQRKSPIIKVLLP